MTPLSRQAEMDLGRIELLERSELVDALGQALAEAAAGRGRMVLLGGEAGVGKTALLRELSARDPRARVLWGACERLFTPRALGPFLDIAETAGVELTGFAPNRRVPHEFMSALVTELRREFPTVLVVEDVHWADEGTLDVVKLLGRRIEALPVLALVSFRDDELTPAAPLQIVLGELAGARAVERRHIAPLSLDAVRSMAEPSGADAETLFEKTGGNPFFVTEALAAADVELPETVRDAVLARTAQLEPRRAGCSRPRRSCPRGSSCGCSRRSAAWISCTSTPAWARGCSCTPTARSRSAMSSPVWRSRTRSPPTGASSSIATCCGAVEPPHGPIDPARLSHHADAAGDVDAVLRHAPEAGNGPPGCASTARPPSSSGARSAMAPHSTPTAERSCGSAGRTSVT